MNALLKSPMATLVRRELWEHRALWIAPLVVAALLLFGVITGAILGHGELVYDSGVELPQNQAALAIGILSFTVPQYLVMLVMLFFYLLDCLYTERKDRSILFWKSMPVSDTKTVLSKLLTALVVVPVGVFVLSLVTDVIVGAIVMIGVHGGTAIWDTAAWLKFRAAMIPGLVLLMLWYAPIASYLLLLSAWARRNVFLWVSLPPLVLMIVENRALGTHYVFTFFQYRLAGIWSYFGSGKGVSDWDDGMPTIGALFQHVGATRAVMDADLWLGVLVAAALTFAAIRIRMYRDDT
jgi:ABC-2 type transport system permease protein